MSHLSEQLSRQLFRFPKLLYAIYYIKYKIEITAAKRIILVATPGHVGSSTVYQSLLTIKWERGTKVYDVHSLNEGFNTNANVASVSARHVLQSVLERNHKQLLRKKIDVISILRDPVARVLGGMFQGQEVFLSNLPLLDVAEHEFEHISKKIKSKLLDDHLLNTINWQFAFYRNELNSFWGFDVDKIKFREGVGIQNVKNRRLIFLTLEHLSEKFPQTILQLYKSKPQVILANNNASPLYMYCKTHLKLSNDVLIKCYKDPLLRAAYDEEEIEQMMLKWSERVSFSG